MNKKLLFAIGIIILVVLGYFALQDETPELNTIPAHNMQPQGMEQMSESGLEIVKESVVIPYKKSYSIDEEWSLSINQFEPNAKISEPGVISSESDNEQNPAVKVDFYKNGELIHYQIVFKEAPGFHSVKPNQKYILDFIDYDGFKVLGNNSYSIKNGIFKIWRIK